MLLTFLMQERLAEGKRVEGALYIDQTTGKLTFKGYDRASRKPGWDKTVCHLEHGWLKESPTRYKLFSSVKKTLGSRLVGVALQRDLRRATERIETIEIIDRV